MKYKINRDFSLKGIKYRTGDITEIPAVSSVRLIKNGLVSEVKAAPKPKKKAKKGDYTPQTIKRRLVVDLKPATKTKQRNIIPQVIKDKNKK